MRETAGSTPQDILQSLVSVPKILSDSKIIDIISRSCPSDLSLLLVQNKGISKEFKTKVIKIIADRIKDAYSPLKALDVVADWPALMKEQAVSKALLSRREEIAKALYRSGNVIGWLHKVVRIPELDTEGIVANAFIQVMRKERVRGNTTDLPSLVLSLRNANPFAIGEVVPSIIANSMMEPWVYEAVLAGNLQHHPVIKEELLTRLDTTFVELLQRNYRYARWHLKPWFMEEIAIHINEMKNPRPLIGLLEKHGYAFSKSGFTRTPRLEIKT
jgi:hypothetical protein